MRALVHIALLNVTLVLLSVIFMTAQAALAQASQPAKPIKVVVLGDSLSAGLGLSAVRRIPGAAYKRP